MQRRQRVRVMWIALISAVVLSGIVIPLWVTADTEEIGFTATLYADVIRFEASGAASLRVTIYDLSENELWSSGVVLGGFADWDRTNEQGERLANGYYLYVAQAWDASDRLILSKTGKVVLLPGDRVELKTAPVVSSPPGSDPWRNDDPLYGPKAYDTTDWHVSNRLGVGTDTPAYPFHVKRTTLGTAFAVEDSGGYTLSFYSDNSGTGTMWIKGGGANKIKLTGSGDSYMNGGNVYMTGGNFGIGTAAPSYQLHIYRATLGTAFAVQDSVGYALSFYTDGAASGTLWIKGSGANTLKLTGSGVSYITGGNLGIGTTDATDLVTIEGSSGNLIACYPDGSRAAGAAVFRVEADGDVYADGTVYSAATAVGSADVAERINVSEWVEAGDVVEIDPEHVGFFRKAIGQYSRRVAGIISTSPGVILGNDVDEVTGKWDDNRPVLAIAGRVPVKVSTENGPIAVGDLLVSSSVPGVAMRGEPAVSIGAVVGKAMEPLDDGVGVIMAQVTLR